MTETVIKNGNYVYVDQSLILLIGIPSSGKTTWAKKNLDKSICIFSSDDLRETYFGDVNDQTNNRIVFEILGAFTDIYLKHGKSVCIDATNLKTKYRKKFIDIAKEINPAIKIIGIYFAVTPEMAIQFQKDRKRQVPEDIIRKMYDSMDFPSEEEGFTEIKFIENKI